MIDWNGPGVHNADKIIEKSLDLCFNGRKNWRFKAAETKFIVSEVLDRQMKVSSKLSFLDC